MSESPLQTGVHTIVNKPTINQTNDQCKGKYGSDKKNLFVGSAGIEGSLAGWQEDSPPEPIVLSRQGMQEAGRGVGEGDSATGDFGAALAALRHQAGLSLRELAASAGCAKSYLSMLESGVRAHPPGEDLVLRLEAALGCRPGALLQTARWQATPESVRRRVCELEASQRAAASELRRVLGPGSGGVGDGAGIGADGAAASAPGTALDRAWRSGRLSEVVSRLAGALEPASDKPPGVSAGAREASGRTEPLARALPLEVPLINSVAAGYPTEFTDLSYPARVADEYVRCPDIKDPDAFAARVVGDSMEPLYREGDIVVFSPNKPVKSGMDCFVRLEPDHEATFKRVEFVSSDQRTPNVGEGPLRIRTPEAPTEFIRLVPLNSTYRERVVSREMVAGLYAAVSVTRAING